MSNVTTLFEKRFFYFDGGMGTQLQARGLKGGERPERWNVERPDCVLQVHADYLLAGCDIVTSNTFGATRAHLGEDYALYMRSGVRLARQAVQQAGRGFVAADMGSLGRLLAPYGDLPFEEAVSQFAEAFQAALTEKPDLILIETMTDLAEVKAAVLGAQAAMSQTGVHVPVFVSMTFDERGRLLTGASIPAAVAMLADMRVAAVGLNCGHEPKALMDNVRALLACCPLPVFVQPNASLPVVKDGVTIFPTGPEEFARDMCDIARLGVQGLGGCCGTTPRHILEMVNKTTKIDKIVSRETCICPYVSGRGEAVRLAEKPILIGERLNPTGKPRMKQALRESDMDYLMREAISQVDNGVDALDLNVGLPGIDEPHMLRRAVLAVQSVCDVPLVLDTADPKALEAALEVYIGRPIINSVCGKRSVMDAVFPLAKRYGGYVIALTLDENGIPATVEGRLGIAQRIIQEALTYGISKERLIFDALTMTVATDPAAARVTLETVRRLKTDLGVKTVLGVSNVSFGLPQRPLLTGGFIAMALQNGLNAAILNPGDLTVRAAFLSGCALLGHDAGFERYLGAFGREGLKLGVCELGAGSPAAPSAQAACGAAAAVHAADDPAANDPDPLFTAIRRGIAGQASAAAETLLQTAEPLQLIETSVMPALTFVGEKYEKGQYFLPQLLQSAAAAQAAFEVIRARMPAREGGEKIILATVRGDVHDIGKNIVKVLLQNYGFTVIDLGRDVTPEAVVAAAREHGARLVGLSALMTTTVPAMAETVALVHRELPGVKVIVGGAVLTADYAAQIGADAYAADAMATVRIAQG